LTRRSSRGANNYFNFFLGVIAICAVYTGVHIKIGQETENMPDPFKDQIEEWTMEGLNPPEIMKSEVGPMTVEEPPVPAKAPVRSIKRDDTTSSFAPSTKRRDEPAMEMVAMPLSAPARDTVGSGHQVGAMMAASVMMDDGGAYQPKTPIKDKWSFLTELYNLRYGMSYHFDAPGYVPKVIVYQPQTPAKNRWSFASELYDLRYGMSYKWDAPGHVWDQPYIDTDLDSGEYNNDAGEIVFLNADDQADRDLYQEGHKGWNENMAVQAA